MKHVFSSRQSKNIQSGLVLPDSSYLMAFSQVHSVSGMLIEVKSLVLVFSRRIVGLLNGVLNIIQLLVEVTALQTTIGMGVVAFLSRGLIGGITKAIYSTMIRDAGVLTGVNLDKKITLFNCRVYQSCLHVFNIVVLIGNTVNSSTKNCK